MTTNISAEELPGIVVFQSDFGLKDGAVSAMQGVAMGVSTDLKLFDLTHEIPAFNIWEASYRLKQTMPYWPAGTVFVSVVDPGVGTERKSVVLKTKTGHYVVTPDNGTLSLVMETLGIEEIRRIDEEINRRKDSTRSYTFHGRDVYAFTGARLASNTIAFDEVGKLLPAEVVSIPYQMAKFDAGTFRGNIPVLDPQYGNVWTNIPADLFEKNDISYGTEFIVEIRKDEKRIYKGVIPYVTTFGDVPTGQPLIYVNSLLDISLALNMSNFAAEFDISSGPGWSVSLKKIDN
ncbi:S-adenosyl-l-methionine hydroxide adenosyltransferase family protein [Parasalinivibrio latis]|uniref:SAM hydrolase/SAM-dependent halogenase family protein n=1 Tax=Parasalinivibrio latis TaxID=2952610 RepID=UPI0030E21405